MKVYVKWHEQNNHIQFFMQQFVESCIKNGFKLKRIPLYDKLGVKPKVMQYFESIYILIQKFFPYLTHRSKTILISAAGHIILKESFPYFLILK